MQLSGKTVVITGASEGIGKEIALRLSGEGCNLALIARNAERLAEVKSKCEDGGAAKVEVYPTDIQNTKLLKTTAENILKDFSDVEVLINNAGIWQKMGGLEDLVGDVIDSVINTNLIALIHLTRLLLPSLKKAKEAAIINISSKSGVVAQAGQSVYTASKYGVRGFTEVLKVDLKDSNIRVAGVYQSGTNTEMFAKTGEKVPSEKFTEPKDLANVVAFMLTQPAKIWLHDVRVTY